MAWDFNSGGLLGAPTAAGDDGADDQKTADQYGVTDPMDVAKSQQLQVSAAQAPFDATVQQLVGSGVPEDMARGLTSGRYVTKELKNDDDTTRIGVVDVSTGKEINPPTPKASPLNPAQSLISSLPTQSRDNPGAPLDYPEATGGMGAVKNGLNVVAGQAGAMPYKDAAAPREALKGLRTRTVTQMTAAIPGRETNAMREQLGPFAVEPGAFSQPDPMARTRLSQTKSMIDAETTKLSTQLETGGLTKSQKGSVQQNILQLQQLSKDHENVLGHFGGGGTGEATGRSLGAASVGQAGKTPGGGSFKIIGVR